MDSNCIHILEQYHRLCKVYICLFTRHIINFYFIVPRIIYDCVYVVVTAFSQESIYIEWVSVCRWRIGNQVFLRKNTWITIVKLIESRWWWYLEENWIIWFECCGESRFIRLKNSYSYAILIFIILQRNYNQRCLPTGVDFFLLNEI